MASLHAYSDESGNTGLNLFDPQQPWFWTVTLIAPKDLDPPATAAVARWSQALAVPDLHGKDLGLQRLEAIAWPIHAFLAEHDCRFIITRMEKRHHASTKFVDTIIDSGINPAVPPHVYSNRLLRLGLAHAIVSHISPKSQEQWWAAFQSGDLDGFRQVVRRVHVNVTRKVTDPRTRELAADALEWAYQHPDEFPELKLKLDEYDSPNFVAFTVLLQGLHTVAGDSSVTGDHHVRIERFIHDEQNQFAQFMETAYKLTKKWEFSALPLAWMTDMAERDTFHCNIVFESRKSIPPLRLADLVLWLVRRYVERGDEFPPDCLRLVEWVSERAHYSELSRRQLSRSVVAGLVALAQIKVSPEGEERGRRIVAQLEEQRKCRLAGEPGPLPPVVP